MHCALLHWLAHAYHFYHSILSDSHSHSSLLPFPPPLSFHRSELPAGSSEEGLSLSLPRLKQMQAVDYRVKVTNTGQMGGGVSVLAFIKSDVSTHMLYQLCLICIYMYMIVAFHSELSANIILFCKVLDSITPALHMCSHRVLRSLFFCCAI